MVKQLFKRLPKRRNKHFSFLEIRKIRRFTFLTRSFHSFYSLLSLFFLSFGLLFFFLPYSSVFAKRKNVIKKSKKNVRRGKKVKVGGFVRPAIIRKKSFRTRRCWFIYKRLKKNIPRWKALVERLVLYHCDVKLRRKCLRAPHLVLCKEAKKTKRWDYCFRIERRLRIFFIRFKNGKKEAQKRRCRWRFFLPRQSYRQDHFSPNSRRFRRRY